MATFTPPLAALTTIFTPPCPITWLLTTTKVPSQIPPFPTTAPASCDPPSWDSYIADRGFEYYSPAICPSGFVVGPSCIVTNPRTGQGFPAIQGGETAAYCVPNGHTCTSDTSDFRGGVWGVSRTATVSGAQVTVGPAIQIRWREIDLAGLETDPLTPGPRTTQPSSTQPPPVESSTETEDSSTPDPTTTSTSSSTPSTTATTTTPSTLSLVPFLTPVPVVEATTFSSVSSSSSSSSSPSSSTSSSSSSSAPPLSPATQGSQPITAPTTSVPASGQQQNTSLDSSPEAPDRTGTGNSSSNFTVAAIVLTAVLITIITGYGAYSILKRYRRYRAGETEGFFVLSAEAWARRLFVFLFRRGKKGAEDGEKGGDERDRRRRWWKMPDAELGTEGPLPELGSSQPFGTKENPAELPIPDRRSWVSRMSKLFTVRMHSAAA